MSGKRPRVIVFGYASLDGRVALGRDRLLLPWGDSAEDWRVWEEMVGPAKAVHDALVAELTPQAFLEGSSSFTTRSAPAEHPSGEGDPSDLYQDFLPPQIISRPGAKSWLAVPDSRGRVRWSLKEVDGVHVLVLVSSSTPAPHLQYLRAESIPYLLCGAERVDLELALNRLAGELGVETVICTSPGKLGGALLRAGLVDEVHLMVLPAVVGGFETPSLFQSPELGRGQSPPALELASVQEIEGGRLHLHYRVRPAQDTG